jgi:hypothetical protein
MRLVQEGYIISKTNSRAMLGRMNSISYNIEARCRMLPFYHSINLDEIEDSYVDWLTQDDASGKYLRTRDYWAEKGLLDK